MDKASNSPPIRLFLCNTHIGYLYIIIYSF
nr:MAG TPA: hypothetical protein [Caudoviricetes sp.]